MRLSPSLTRPGVCHGPVLKSLCFLLLLLVLGSSCYTLAKTFERVLTAPWVPNTCEVLVHHENKAQLFIIDWDGDSDLVVGT